MKLSWKQVVRVVACCAVFGVAMALREELSGVALRALVGGLGGAILGIGLLPIWLGGNRR